VGPEVGVVVGSKVGEDVKVEAAAGEGVKGILVLIGIEEGVLNPARLQASRKDESAVARPIVATIRKNSLRLMVGLLSGKLMFTSEIRSWLADYD
jgi:hypothetical protein